MLAQGQGSFLMEKSAARHSYHTSHIVQRPGIKIVTAVQSGRPHLSQHHMGQGHVINGHSARHHSPSVEDDRIDFNKLAEDAADLFGDDDNLAIDPSLSEFALQVCHALIAVPVILP